MSDQDQTKPATETAAAAPAFIVPAGYTEAVTLKRRPVQRAGQPDVTTISLREPLAGDLRGLNLPDVLQMQQQAITTLLPRISTPALTPAEYTKLHVADFTALAVKVVGFFVDPDETAAAV